MKTMYVKPVFGSPEEGKPSFNPEVKTMYEWLVSQRDNNHIDMDVLTYPQTGLLCAYEKPGGEPIVFVPHQKVHMLDGVAVNPKASAADIALGLAQIIRTIHYEAFKAGMGETYLPASDAQIAQYAINHGFIPMNIDVQREGKRAEDKAAPERRIISLQEPMLFLKLKSYS